VGEQIFLHRSPGHIRVGQRLAGVAKDFDRGLEKGHLDCLADEMPVLGVGARADSTKKLRSSGKGC
jgi:hypothetical protein